MEWEEENSYFWLHQISKEETMQKSSLFRPSFIEVVIQLCVINIVELEKKRGESHFHIQLSTPEK